MKDALKRLVSKRLAIVLTSVIAIALNERLQLGISTADIAIIGTVASTAIVAFSIEEFHKLKGTQNAQ